MAKGKLFSLDHMAVGCVVIAGIVEAAQQALSGAPNVSRALPQAFISPNINYVPFGLIMLAGLLWVVNQFRSPPAAVMSSDGTRLPDRDQFSLPVAVGPSLPVLVAAPEPEEPEKPERDHSLIDVSPFELSAFFDQHLTPQAEKLLEPYLGRRLRLVATVVDVDVNRGGGRVYVYATIPDPSDPKWTGVHVHLYFDQNWKSRLLILKRGNPITAVGYIERAASRMITLDNCGLELADNV
jgi:hypothetical protein